jgi:hypothetical protein
VTEAHRSGVIHLGDASEGEVGAPKERDIIPIAPTLQWVQNVRQPTKTFTEPYLSPVVEISCWRTS